MSAAIRPHGQTMQWKTTVIVLQCLLITLIARVPVYAADAFISGVVSFSPGAGSGFGIDQLPDVVLGPPRGGGELQGSLDVVSLGDGGEIVVELDAGICNEPGADFTVFENAFRAGGSSGMVFAEVGIIAVSDDGEDFFEFPYDAETYAGLAGQTPIFSDVGNGIDPRDPQTSGGDSFDLTDIGLESVRFVRITDPGAAIADPGNRLPPGISGGFDLDAIAAVHPCTPVLTSPGDLDEDGDVDDADLMMLSHLIFDDEILEVDEATDTNSDAAITAADLVGAAIVAGAPR